MSLARTLPWSSAGRHGSAGLAVVAAAACLALAAGCEPTIEHEYGHRNGFHPDSVNGTAVFAEMFENAGHTVYSWWVLSPRLHKRADCIVWFPDDFQPPTREVRAWLEDWLMQKADRTLIYVGRDFDAEPGYWQKILPLAPADQRTEVQQRLTDAQTRVAGLRSAAPTATLAAAPPPTGKPPRAKPPAPPPTSPSPEAPSPVLIPPVIKPLIRQPLAAPPPAGSRPWFRLDTTGPSRRARSLSGEYAQNIDATKTEIELETRLVPPVRWASLLNSGRDRIVTVRQFGKSRLILVVNGSFLLNLPLLNHEHRKLAGELIAEIGPAGKKVVFLESGPGGPSIRAKDPDPHQSSGIEILAVWPTNWILLQAIAVGILACFRRWPIFGVPRPGPAAAASDFGRHITALAELMRRSRDRTFAQMRLAQWRQKEQGTDCKTAT